MQPNDDQHEDVQLRNLLREWQAPETPASLERRVLGSGALGALEKPQAWWRFLVNGYIRVPVSVACALAVLLMVAMWRVSIRPPAPCVAEKIAAPENPASQTALPNGCKNPAPGVC
jgi:hypothetical protein